MTYRLIMTPFIGTYHLVKAMFKIPVTILEYAWTGILYVIDLFSKEKKKTLNRDYLQQNITFPKQVTDNSIATYSFNYVAKNRTGKIIKSSFDAPSIKEVNMFLTNEGYEIISVEPRKPYDIDLFGNRKIKTSELSFALTQISTYIKAGISLIDSVRILAKQTENKARRKNYEKIIYELLTGKNFSDALERQGKVFPKLLINMVRTAEKTGDLAAILDDMADYYKSIEETRKQMISAMTYPTIIFVVSLFVVAFILTTVVPNFVDMFESNNAELPAITVLVMNISEFLKNNYLLVLSGLILVLFVYRYLFKKIKSFRKTMQSIFMHLPIIGKIIIYNEVTVFTKTFASLLNHSVYITESMEILSNLTDNEVYRNIIDRTLINLGTGAKISESFKDEWAFPVAAYEMLVTGENTGQLGLMMEKVSEYYQGLHKNAVTGIKNLVEPVMILFLAIAVGFIVLSLVIPMFDLYGTL